MLTLLQNKLLTLLQIASWLLTPLQQDIKDKLPRGSSSFLA